MKDNIPSPKTENPRQSPKTRKWNRPIQWFQKLRQQRLALFGQGVVGRFERLPPCKTQRWPLQWFCCCTLLEPGTPDSVLFEGVGAVSGLREKLKTSDHESNWDRIRPAATCTDTVQLRSQASLAAALKTTSYASAETWAIQLIQRGRDSQCLSYCPCLHAAIDTPNKSDGGHRQGIPPFDPTEELHPSEDGVEMRSHHAQRHAVCW
eukprot:CAMPEP_0174324812 /NCGR_PEP_ID=MMETSP0810-20121108/12753_1 /TAXON_ID=73025 ORGANISM="Eutreptiella gymnastica-like, Strain CCMP1594" /NCGR_SAMPLE_ID=MMETSP0810 /ASSEMBLY_ACC=CAM_ASM_000659 /LENGTH=206 /DNA_ID=CAMNT_0015437757 /DNA_START=185 /DNA_END=804 /DNA_ORIENTATION=+